MRRVVKLLFALAAVGGLVAAAYLAAKPEPPEVAAKRVKRTSIEDTVPGVSTGVVEVARRVAVQAESWGRVREVRVKRGDRVKTGDVLVTLDDSDLRDQVRALEAAIPVLGARVRQAGTRADQLGRDQDRARRLFEAGSLPAAQAEQAASGKDLARLDREAASAALAQARVNLDVARAAVRKTTVRAPFDGVVLDVFAEVGQVAGSGLGGGASLGAGQGGATGGAGTVGAGAAALAAAAAAGGSGQRGLVDLADDSEVSVFVDVDEADYWRIRPGQPAIVTLDALGRRRVDGSVAEVFPYISRALDQNRTARVKVRLPDAVRAEVLPGMSANVEVVVASRSGVLVLPTPCVVTRMVGKVALVVDGDRLRENRIDVEVSTWEWTAIRSGLAEGDLVAVPPGDVRLTDGMRVVAREE